MIRRNIISAAALAAGLVALPAVVQAQGILDIGRVILGLPTEQKEPIDYRERAPIVVPPSQNLRPPAETVPAEQRRANWPQDPDVQARRRAAEDSRKPVDFSSTFQPIGTSRRLTLEEIRAGRVAGAEVPRTPTSVGPRATEGFTNIYGGITTINELDKRDAAKAANGDLARAEPKREFLTDPPTGLRRPADNAAFRATREGRVGTREEPKPYDIFREGPNTR
jgi:hypothetical protein